MRINTRIRQLVSERMALLAQAHEIKQSLQSIPRVKHIRMEFSLQPIRELSAEEQALADAQSEAWQFDDESDSE